MKARLLALLLTAPVALAGPAATDSLGHRIELQQPAGRIISLSASATEQLRETGASAALVAVSQESAGSVNPDDLPIAGDRFRLNPAVIRRLQPDLILAEASGPTLLQLKTLENEGYRIFYRQPDSLEGIAADALILGHLSAHEYSAEARVKTYRTELANLRRQYQKRSPVTVFLQQSELPGSGRTARSRYAAEAIHICGGRPAEHSALIQQQDIIRADPDIIISLAGHASLKQWQAYPQITAVRRGQLYQADPQLLTRTSLNILTDVAILCRQIDQAR